MLGQVQGLCASTMPGRTPVFEGGFHATEKRRPVKEEAISLGGKSPELVGRTKETNLLAERLHSDKGRVWDMLFFEAIVGEGHVEGHGQAAGSRVEAELLQIFYGYGNC